jgi:hypothetical protein
VLRHEQHVLDKPELTLDVLQERPDVVDEFEMWTKVLSVIATYLYYSHYFAVIASITPALVKQDGLTNLDSFQALC